ncbi:hypothetical protein DW982_10410 [Phocaeicola plebeius]|nr:hypothetical protein DW982_10410 [Phocaeicola plebeius]
MTKINSQISKIYKNSIYIYGNTAFSMLVSLISTRLILNALGSSDFGIFCIVGGAIGMLGFINGSMAGATQRFINYAEGAGQETEKRRIVNASIFIHFCISFVALIAFEIAYYFFFNGILNIPHDRIYAAKIIYQFTVISTLLTIQTTPYNALINAHEDLKYYSIIGCIFTFIKLLIAIIIVVTSHDKLILYGFFTTITSLLNIIIVRIYCHKKYTECIFSPKKYLDSHTIKKMFSFASCTLLTTVTSMISTYGGNIVINKFFGTSINAAQGVSSQISGQLMVFSNNMLMAVNPVIGKKAGAKDYHSMIKYAITSSKLSYLILLFFAVPFIIEADWIMTFWLKNVPDWAVIFLRFEIARKLLEQLIIGIKNAVVAEGNIKQLSRVQSIIYLLPLPITYILFYYGFQPVWLYITWILCLNIIAGYNIITQARKHCNLDIRVYFNSLIYKCLSVSIIIIIFGYIPHVLLQQSFVRIIIVTLTVSTAYIIMTWNISLSNEEKNIIKNIILTTQTKIKGIYKNHRF